MAKHEDNWLVVLLSVLLAICMPLTAWFMLRTATLQARDEARQEKYIGLRDEVKEELKRLQAARKAAEKGENE